MENIKQSKTIEELRNENFELKSRLNEAEDTLSAIQNGEIDAIVTPQGSNGPKVYTLKSADYLYRILVEEMSEGVATLTNDGTIFYSNAQLASMLKIPLEKMAGKKLNNFVIPEDQGTYLTLLDKGLKSRSNGEISLQSTEGRNIPVYISINSVKDLTGLYIVITDLSEQKLHEQLKTSNKELRETQDELMDTVNKLEISNNELKNFAYVTSHDLREPLRMITSFLQLLERRYTDQLDQDAKDFIGYAVDGAKRLDSMINDILIYSKVSKGRELSEVNFNKVIEKVYVNLISSIEETDAEIIYDSLPTLITDESLMIQLFQNLISNALKYRSKEKPEIYVAVKDEGNEYVFSVKDNGIGIDQKHAHNIYTIFKRLHTSEEYEGTGIGLAIAQKIVQQQGGKIWVESELDKGSTFYFTIPKTNLTLFD